MKILILFTMLITTNVFASNDLKNNKCKIEALAAAFNDYTSIYSDSIISTKTKFKPIIDETKITYVVQILDLDRGNDQFYTVSLDKNNCKVISID